MKKQILALLFLFILSILFSQVSHAQCSICTKTAQQLGEQPAKGLNAGIIYLASAPFLIAGYIFYRWKKSTHSS
jgi:general stress protein CsbA